MSEKTAVPTIPQTEKSQSVVPTFLTSRRGLMILAAAMIIAALVFSRDWLVAIGMAPILIAMLPCLVMCGLGLCMNKMTGGSCENGAAGKDGESK